MNNTEISDRFLFCLLSDKNTKRKQKNDQGEFSKSSKIIEINITVANLHRVGRDISLVVQPPIVGVVPLVATITPVVEIIVVRVWRPLVVPVPSGSG